MHFEETGISRFQIHLWWSLSRGFRLFHDQFVEANEKAFSCNALVTSTLISHTEPVLLQMGLSTFWERKDLSAAYRWNGERSSNLQVEELWVQNVIQSRSPTLVTFNYFAGLQVIRFHNAERICKFSVWVLQRQASLCAHLLRAVLHHWQERGTRSGRGLSAARTARVHRTAVWTRHAVAPTPGPRIGRLYDHWRSHPYAAALLRTRPRSQRDRLVSAERAPRRRKEAGTRCQPINGEGVNQRSIQKQTPKRNCDFKGSWRTTAFIHLRNMKA